MTTDNMELAEGWRPSEGDIVRGTITDITMATSDYNGSKYPIIEIQTEDGAVAVHGFHAVLRNKLAQLKPMPGETIAIKYIGKSKKEPTTKGMSPPELYVAKMPERTSTDVWSEIQPDTANVVEDDIPF